MSKSPTEAVKPFSEELQDWLKSNKPKTLLSLDKVFAEKSFAIIFILLLAPSALPVPTGGITTVFEVVAIIIASQMLIGRRSLWLPKRWRHLRVGKFMQQRILPKLISFIRWFERYSRPRGAYFLQTAIGRLFFGLVVVIITAAALISPPFSGLDTLPSLGVAIISLGVILEDILLFLFGLIVGIVGIGLIIVLGSAAINILGGLL